MNERKTESKKQDNRHIKNSPRALDIPKRPYAQALS